MIFYPLAATLISAAFAVTLGLQYRAKPRPYLLVWAVALGLYAIAALTEVIGAAGGWNAALYRIYYYLGAIVLVGGAVWSAYGTWRRGGAPSRLLANILIAAGALIVASVSTLTRLFHIYELFYVGQAIGVLVMFAGFLAAQRAPSRAAKLNPATSR